MQLIVLHPDRRALGGDSGRRLRKLAVHVDVRLPPFAVVLRLDDHIVVQRPQGGVGEALVVFGDFLGGKPDRVQHHVVFGNRLDIRIGHARPADPGTAALA